VKLQIKPATAQECAYVERDRPCHEPAVGELRGHSNFGQHPPWPMCTRHIKPEMHPPDLRRKLYRWTIIR
jgi:hypothetical protein